MRRSLALKLVLAFLLVSLVGVTLVAILSRAITVREFDRLTLEEARNSFVVNLSASYQAYGSWEGVAEAYRRRAQPYAPVRPDERLLPHPPFARLPQFGLADEQGYVVLPANSYQVGERVPADVLDQGLSVDVDGRRVGTVLFANTPPPRNPQEQRYLVRTNLALLISAMGAVIIALGIGAVLARTLTRSLRELTAATQAMAGGDLPQVVPVRSDDELGQLAASFNRMSADLARAHQLRRQMTADIAHDLRTPLTVITGYIEALRDGDLKPTPERFEAMYVEARHLTRLIQDLRILSLADAGELPLNRQPVSVADLLERVATTYHHPAEQQGNLLELMLPADLPEIEADPERLAQVLGNLVGNAMRYTPEGGRIILAASRQSDAIMLRVEDTGSGIPPEELPYVFNRFYRGDKARRQTESESGLGLAIAKAIVEAHGGSMAVESEVGQGTTFIIRLPVPDSR